MIPPQSTGPSGSHGALPSYTGNDEDFLRQAGNPHFASLRHFEYTFQVLQEVFGPFPETSGGIVHVVGSTHPEEVRAKQGEPLLVGSLNLTPDPTNVERAIAQLDETFDAVGFPRRGLYLVFCGVTIEASPVPSRTERCVPDPAAFRPDVGIATEVGYRDDLVEIPGPFGFRATRSIRTTARFFIPALAPGRRLVSARYRSFLVGGGDLFAVRLSGKPPLPDSSFRCNDLGICFGEATWDFTPEATALATAGGGELELTFDPSPPFVDRVSPPFSTIREAAYALVLDVSYPWSHGDARDALTLTIEEECPKALMVSVTLGSVPPQLPGRPIETAAVTALVKTCPAQEGPAPGSVEVYFEVQPPATDSSDAAGHDHDTRPTSAIGSFEPVEAKCVVTTFDSQGMGSCNVTYKPSAVSGVERIIGRADGFDDAQAKVTVRIPGLEELPDGVTYVLVGAPANHAGTNDPCRATPPASRHNRNHFGVPQLDAAVKVIADTMLFETSILLRVNDMSLVWGGLFDFKNDWKPPHRGHRAGRAADIGFKGVRNGVCTDYDLELLEIVIREVTKNAPVVEDGSQPHFHAFIR